MEMTVMTERVLDTFLDLVRLDSPSGQEGPVRDYLISAFKGLGIAHQVDAAGNLIADVPGQGAAAGSGALVLSAHMDVVPPCLGVQPVVTGEGEERWVASGGDTVLGADDKAGLAAILEAVQVALAEPGDRPPLRLLFTVREETSLMGAKALAPEALAGAAFSIVVDNTSPQGNITLAAPTYRWFEIRCEGRSTHAAIAPEEGINAIALAARIASRLPVGRIDPETTANIGWIEGGKAINVVPDTARIVGELRSHTPATLDRLQAEIEATVQEATASLPGSTIQLRFEDHFHAYRIAEQHPGVQAVADAVRRVGLTPRFVTTNGGSDNNVYVHAHGVPGVVISAGYVEPHALTERIAVRELVQCADILRQAITTFSEARLPGIR